MPGVDTAADAAAMPFDPYELKDMVGGTVLDPYPLLHELRRESPVHTGPIDLGDGEEVYHDPTKPPPVTVFGFEEVVQVLRDNETYSSVVYEDVMGIVMGRTILQMDEPEHKKVRDLVASSFRSKMLARWEEELVAVVVNDLVDSFVAAGPHRPRPLRHLQLPRAGHRAHPRVAASTTTRASSAGRSSSPAWPRTGTAASRRRRPSGTTSRT